MSIKLVALEPSNYDDIVDRTDGVNDYNRLTDTDLADMFDQGIDQDPGVPRLERDYLNYDKPDRLRVVDPAGTFYDVIVLGPNNIGVQNIPFSIDYAQPIDYYSSFEQTQELLDTVVPGWETHSPVNASSKNSNTTWVDAKGSINSALLILASAIIRLK